MKGETDVNREIKKIISSIYKDIYSKSKSISKNLQEDLKFQEISSSQEDYLNSLKHEIIYNKVNIRNIEFILGKWIEKKSIPNKNQVDMIIKEINRKSKDYVEKGKNSHGQSFNESDKKILLSYENMKNEEAKSKLEDEYRVLYIYNLVLNAFIDEFIISNIYKEVPDNSKEVIKFIRSELRKCITALVKVINSYKEEEIPIENNEANEKVNESKITIEESTKEQNKESLKEPIIKESVKGDINSHLNLTYLESAYLRGLNNINDEDLSKKMDKEYRKLCIYEEVKYSKGYGFGAKGIQDYIRALILIDIVDEDNKFLINSGIRHVINGDFGIKDFMEFMKYVAINILEISEDVWEKGSSIIEEEHFILINHELANKKLNPCNCDNLDNYIKNMERQSEQVNYTKDDSSNNEKIDNEEVNMKSKKDKDDYESNQSKDHNSHKNKLAEKFKNINLKNKKLLCIGAFALALCIVVVGIFIPYKKKADIQKATEKLYEITAVNREYTTYTYSPDDNYVKDENIKKNYYIFSESNMNDNGEYYKYNYAINKKDLTVYFCNEKGLFVPYTDYVNRTTPVGVYVDHYYYSYYNQDSLYNLPDESQTYLIENGGEAFYKKIKSILDMANSNTVSYCGGPVEYVECILKGETKENLDKQSQQYNG